MLHLKIGRAQSRLEVQVVSEFSVGRTDRRQLAITTQARWISYIGVQLQVSWLAMRNVRRDWWVWDRRSRRNPEKRPSHSKGAAPGLIELSQWWRLRRHGEPKTLRVDPRRKPDTLTPVLKVGSLQEDGVLWEFKYYYHRVDPFILNPQLRIKRNISGITLYLVTYRKWWVDHALFYRNVHINSYFLFSNYMNIIAFRQWFKMNGSSTSC